MTNQEFKTWGIEQRERYEVSDFVEFCFQIGELCYAVTLRSVPERWVKIERAAASKGGALKARIRPSAAEKRALMAQATCRVLGTREMLANAYDAAYQSYVTRKGERKATPKNDGWMYECAVTERAGQTWEPDQVPFWKAPDLTVNGIGYQIKGDCSEYFNEKNLRKCIEEMG